MRKVRVFQLFNFIICCKKCLTFKFWLFRSCKTVLQAKNLANSFLHFKYMFKLTVEKFSTVFVSNKLSLVSNQLY